MTRRMQVAAALVVLCLLVPTSWALADTYYYIQVHEDIPEDEPSAPEEPVFTAVVISIESDSVPDVPEPDSPGGPEFYEVSLDSLEALGYMAPEDVLEHAEEEGDVQTVEADGWWVSGYYYPRYHGWHLKRVSIGGKIARHWWNPGPMSLRSDAWAAGTSIHRIGTWRSAWGWSKYAYYDFSYNKNSTYRWGSQMWGSPRYDHKYWQTTNAGGRW